jgi:hypothetical protein
MFMQHWPLAVATVLITAVAMQLAWHSVARSASGQLRRALGERQEQARISGKARATTAKLEARLDAMLKKSEKVKPSALQECKEALQDARALQNIAEDKLLIAENHVRRVIHEEFPPVRQPKLRARYLPEVTQDRRPFSF